MANKVYRLLNTVVLILILSVSSCKTSSNISSGDKVSKGKISTREVYANLESNATDYTTYSGKYNASMLGINTKVQVKIIRDEVVSLSIQPFLGIEVARIVLKPDSIYLIDKIGSRASVERISNITDKIPSGTAISLLQNLLTNATPPDITGGVKTVSIPQNGDPLLFINNITSDIVAVVDIDPILWVVNSTLLNVASGYIELQQHFSSYKTTPQGALPQIVDVDITFKGNTNVSAQFELLSSSFDTKVDYSTKIPSKYKIVDFKELIRTYIP